MYFHYFVMTSICQSKWVGPSFEQTWIPFTQEWVVPIFVEVRPVVLEKIFKFRERIFFIS